MMFGPMMPPSAAMQQRGAAQRIAEGLVTAVGDGGAHALPTGPFVASAVVGQVISNTAAALIIIPISVMAAQQMPFRRNRFCP